MIALGVEGMVEVSRSIRKSLHVFSEAMGGFKDQEGLQSDVEGEGGEGGPVVVPNAGAGEVAG